MAKCKNSMELFFYIKIPLSHPFLNVLTGSEGYFPCQFMLNFGPSHTLHICVPLPLPVCLYLQFLSHLPIYLHLSLHLYLSPTFYPRPPHIPPLHLLFYPRICQKLHPYIFLLFIILFIIIIFLSIYLSLITFFLLSMFISSPFLFLFHYLFHSTHFTNVLLFHGPIIIAYIFLTITHIQTLA